MARETCSSPAAPALGFLQPRTCCSTPLLANTIHPARAFMRAKLNARVFAESEQGQMEMCFQTLMNIWGKAFPPPPPSYLFSPAIKRLLCYCVQKEQSAAASSEASCEPGLLPSAGQQARREQNESTACIPCLPSNSSSRAPLCISCSQSISSSTEISATAADSQAFPLQQCFSHLPIAAGACFLLSQATRAPVSYSTFSRLRCVGGN